ncbi:19329_t:CDS:2 [Cetraspora pellucida]|uniref:19329_t:CDS:1 n=1 Tax=Cetraspora pellucida TaxID=1433469 RepID=A0A9N9HNC5_9GLOM|nr:19329_t:CDS:2 [Cetraspora pellucida]
MMINFKKSREKYQKKKIDVSKSILQTRNQTINEINISTQNQKSISKNQKRSIRKEEWSIPKNQEKNTKKEK